MILCAGAIGSAALLLSSGIGPDTGLPVGRAVQEHPEVLLDLPAELLAMLPDVESEPADPLEGLPPLLSHVIRLELPGGVAGRSDSAAIEVRPYAVPLNRVSPGLDPVPHRIGVALMNPVGRGTVSLGAADGPVPGVGIVLADDPRDADALDAAADLVAERLGLGAAARRVTLSTSHHLSGTARIGEVVDEAGRVLGVDGLRVADASVLPSLPRCGPYYTVLAVAEVLAARVVAGRSW